MTINLPVNHVTSCVFGGEKMNQLYISTRPSTLSSGGIYVATNLNALGASPSLFAG